MKRSTERALRADWEQLLSKHSKPLERGAKAKGITKTFPLSSLPSEPKQLRRVGSDLYAKPSRGVPSGVAEKVVNNVYTGNVMLGVATMHKSNSVPVFSKDDAVDISKMRR